MTLEHLVPRDAGFGPVGLRTSGRTRLGVECDTPGKKANHFWFGRVQLYDPGSWETVK